MTHTYQIKGMTCNGCIAKVKSELLKLGDIISADVQLSDLQSTITMSKHIPTPVLQAAISKAGAFSIEESMNHHVMADVMSDEGEEKKSYFPIFLIFGFIAVVSLLGQVSSGIFSAEVWMRYFMAGFFLVFSFFKLLNLQGFKDGYSTYDIVAKKVPMYGYVYPFIELILGIAFLINYNPVLTNSITLIVMGVSSVGVIQSLLKKQTVQCACLGTIIQLPLSKVTLFEDLLMVVMSASTLLVLS